MSKKWFQNISDQCYQNEGRVQQSQFKINSRGLVYITHHWLFHSSPFNKKGNLWQHFLKRNCHILLPEIVDSNHAANFNKL